MPVLAVAGALDRSDVKATAHHLAQTCARARAVIMPDVAHLLPLEAPDATAELILDLVAELDRPG